MNFILLLFFKKKNFFYSTQLSKLERKVVSNHLLKVNLIIPFLPKLTSTRSVALLNVDFSLNDYSNPLNIQTKANSSTTFSIIFFIWSISRHRKTSKLSREVRTKAEFDHHRVKRNKKAFHGWKSNVIFMEHACSYCM